MKQTCYVKTDSPIGQLFLITDQISIISLEFFAVQASIPVLTENLPLMKEALAELQAYFAGTLRQFSVPLNPTGTTFQRSVWEWTQAVSYGETVSYGDLAHKLNRLAVQNEAVGEHRLVRRHTSGAHRRQQGGVEQDMSPLTIWLMLLRETGIY